MQRLLAGASVACLVLAGLVMPSPAGATDVVILVRPSASQGTIALRLGTQFAWPGGLDRAADSRSRFDALAPRLVRINATTDGAPGLPLVMPAGITQGDWDFTNLDAIVKDARRAGAQVALDIAYAPQWMWDCSTGAIRDPTFGEFAGYMARVVSYYNAGSFIAEDGRVVVNPAGSANRIDYWELWNEPDLRTLGCPPAGNPNISAPEYLTMWNATAPAILAVDPSVKLIGPATSSALTMNSPDYLPTLITGAKRKPDAVSFHAYGGWENSQMDRFFFDGDSSCCGLPGLERGVAQVQATAPGIPVWLTELNVNAAWDEDDPAQRPWTAFGATWSASAFLRLARRGVDAAYEFGFAHPTLRQFSRIEIDTGRPLLPYWVDYYFTRYFPPGSTLIEASTSDGEVETIAARPPGSRDVHVLVVNRKVESDSAVGGLGLPANVRVNVQDLEPIEAVTLRQIDAATPLDTGPQAESLAPSNSVSVAFSGYGVALLEFVIQPCCANTPSCRDDDTAPQERRRPQSSTGADLKADGCQYPHGRSRLA